VCNKSLSVPRNPSREGATQPELTVALRRNKVGSPSFSSSEVHFLSIWAELPAAFVWFLPRNPESSLDDPCPCAYSQPASPLAFFAALFSARCRAWPGAEQGPDSTSQSAPLRRSPSTKERRRSNDGGTWRRALSIRRTAPASSIPPWEDLFRRSRAGSPRCSTPMQNHGGSSAIRMTEMDDIHATWESIRRQGVRAARGWW